MVNKIVKIKWPQFCKEDEELLNSFPQGLDMTSYKCAAAMTSIYKRLYTDEKFRDCFWSAVNATGIFKRKFFGKFLDHNKISEGLLRLHSELKETHIEDV
ncbi:predicted protein [Chaetoceros tenuissimus]|uniref:Uncharacterized protein n=1 Tax=Chaetoceros tenuissimus TaxID=426638 RepID=A0AAD3D5N2_9STRA|nr:predicted protein [Chaetoceros tenuissimus]